MGYKQTQQERREIIAACKENILKGEKVVIYEDEDENFERTLALTSDLYLYPKRYNIFLKGPIYQNAWYGPQRNELSQIDLEEYPKCCGIAVLSGLEGQPEANTRMVKIGVVLARGARYSAVMMSDRKGGQIFNALAEMEDASWQEILQVKNKRTGNILYTWVKKL